MSRQNGQGQAAARQQSGVTLRSFSEFYGVSKSWGQAYTPRVAGRGIGSWFYAGLGMAVGNPYCP
tara:strand:- start:612 stop:806 length:195 start_codon:yes stop_codon:yes gene_type:complete